MHIDWWTLGIQAVNVLVLIWLLGRFLFKPVTAMIDRRQQAARAILDEAEAARQAALAERATAASEHAALKAGHAAAEAAAVAAADRAAAAVIDAAQAEAARITARATEAADRAAAARTTEVEAAARTLAARIAARLLDRLPVAARLDGFIDGFAQALDGLPDAVKQRFTDGGETLVLLAATEVSAATRAALEAAIGRVLGSVPPLEIRVEPALIAGFEAAADHAVVTNSFRADLAQIAREFARDDRQ